MRRNTALATAAATTMVLTAGAWAAQATGMLAGADVVPRDPGDPASTLVSVATPTTTTLAPPTTTTTLAPIVVTQQVVEDHVVVVRPPGEATPSGSVPQRR